MRSRRASRPRAPASWRRLWRRVLATNRTRRGRKRTSRRQSCRCLSALRHLSFSILADNVICGAAVYGDEPGRTSTRPASRRTTDRRRRSARARHIDRRRPLGRRSRWRPPCRTCWGRAASRRPWRSRSAAVAHDCPRGVEPALSVGLDRYGDDLGVEPAASAHVPDLPPARYRAPRARYPPPSPTRIPPCDPNGEGIRGGTAALRSHRAAGGPMAMPIRPTRCRLPFV